MRHILSAKLSGDLPAGGARKAIEKDIEHDDPDEDHFAQPDTNEFEDHMAMKAAEHESDEDLDEAIHSGWMFVDSGSEDDHDQPAAIACEESKITRARVSAERPEFQECAKLGLVERPAGCTIGIHPGSMIWRAAAHGCSHHGRSFTSTCGRTPKQALLRVIQLMLSDHVEQMPQDRLAKKQLARVTEARAAEPAHKD